MVHLQKINQPSGTQNAGRKGDTATHEILVMTHQASSGTDGSNVIEVVLELSSLVILVQ